MFTRPGPKGGLFRIAAGGGTPELVAAPDAKAGEQDYVNPTVLPDGSTVVFVVRSASGGNSRLTIAARSLASGQQKILVEGAVHPMYATNGYLLYVQGGVLTGSRFDADRLALVGPAVPLVNGIISKGSNANVGVSSNGTLTYIPGSTINYVSRFIWRARDGQVLGATGPDKLEYPRYPRISPDGRKLVATIGPAQEGHIWVYDTAGAAQPYKITFNAHNTQPTWSPDGSRVAFISTRDGPTRNVFVVPADGSIVEPSHLVTNDKDKTVDRVVSGRLAGLPAARRLDPDRPVEAARQGDGKSEPWVQTPFAESSPAFSPTESGWRSCPIRRALTKSGSARFPDLARPCACRQRRARPRLVARRQGTVLSGRLEADGGRDRVNDAAAAAGSEDAVRRRIRHLGTEHAAHVRCRRATDGS